MKTKKMLAEEVWLGGGWGGAVWQLSRENNIRVTPRRDALSLTECWGSRRNK